MTTPAPQKSGYTWQTVTVTQADGWSMPIDISAAAIIAIATQATMSAAIFWIQVEIAGGWFTIAQPNGYPLDLRLMASRAMAIPIEYTRPYDRARLAMQNIDADYVFQVCVEAL